MDAFQNPLQQLNSEVKELNVKIEKLYDVKKAAEKSDEKTDIQERIKDAKAEKEKWNSRRGRQLTAQSMQQPTFPVNLQSPIPHRSDIHGLQTSFKKVMDTDCLEFAVL